MTRPDVTALSGDPLAETTETEWAIDLLHRFATMSPRAIRQTLRDLTDDERDMLDAVASDGAAEFCAYLDWLKANSTLPVAA